MDHHLQVCPWLSGLAGVLTLAPPSRWRWFPAIRQGALARQLLNADFHTAPEPFCEPAGGGVPRCLFGLYPANGRRHRSPPQASLQAGAR